MDKIVVVLVALYHYGNFPLRIMHPLLERIEGAEPHTIFFKHCERDLFNPPTDKEEKLFIRLITELKPKLVGFSVLSPYVSVATRLTKLVKNNSPSSLVVWGGIHLTVSPETCIQEADILCIGEGEGAITDLVKALRDKKPYQSIKNLWVKKDDLVIKNPMRPLIQDLDSLPFPSYGNDTYYFIDRNRLTRDDVTLLGGSLMVEASRGCPYSCSYCVNGLLQTLFKDLGPYIRRRSVCNVIKEMKDRLTLYKTRIRWINICDEVFGTEESWLDEFVLQYKKEIGLPFHVKYNPKSMNSMIVNKLVSARLSGVNLGIQSGSDYIRNQIFNRPGKNSEIISLAKEIINHGIIILYDFILNNPYETEESLENTIEFLLQLPQPRFFRLYSLQFFPNYPLTKRAIEDGYIKPEEIDVNTSIEKTRISWKFVPKYPHTRKQMLQNVIWLIVRRSVAPKDSLVRYAVFGNSLGSKLCLLFLNFKSIVLYKILRITRKT